MVGYSTGSNPTLAVPGYFNTIANRSKDNGLKRDIHDAV